MNQQLSKIMYVYIYLSVYGLWKESGFNHVETNDQKNALARGFAQ